MRNIQTYIYMVLLAASARLPVHTVLAATAFTHGANSPVTFQPYRAALREARALHKSVLLLFTNPHCGPCRAFESLVLADPIGSSVVAAGYVPVRLTARLASADVLTTEETQLSKQFGIVGVPRAVVFSPEGKEVARFGWSSKQEVLQLLRVHAGARPERAPVAP